MYKLLLGKLSLDDIPYHEPIIMSAVVFMIMVGLFVISTVTYLKKWNYIWTEWITSVDHKKIGVMYIILAFIMLLRGFSDAILMRIQQAIAFGGNKGYLPPNHYDQIFTAHGVIMIFFMAMPFMVGLMNIIIPLQIGARDVAFPFLNSLSFWLTAMSAILINISLAIGEFAHTGWLAYPPLSETMFSPGVGIDYWIWSLQISGIGTLLTGINFFITILKMRATGMSLMKMPVFTWTTFCSNILIILSFPILTATITLLSLDRYLGMHFFTNELGGNQMMYVNLIWAWGHPEVYILILPAFGIFSEVVATFCKKKLFGYNSLVYATIAITILSFMVWLHHFFTMGAGANVNAFFGIATMIIAIPTGVKIFNWLFTMYRGSIEFSSPILWTIGFLVTFTIGGMAGVLLAVPGADYVLHNSLFLVAHFHTVIIGGVVFGYIAGITYWFPKVFGFKLNETLGKCAFWSWIIGFFIAFMPLYWLGLMGMTRRINYYDNSDWNIFLVIAAIGSLIIFLGIIFQFLQIFYSIFSKNKKWDITGDPWNGRTLEWSVSSPAPFYNFSIIPTVTDRDAFWDMKEKGYNIPKNYKTFNMPKSTASGFIISLFSLIVGFSLVWHIWWLVITSTLGIIITYIIHIFNDDTEYSLNAEHIDQIENSIIYNI
ncbi:Ubiquinol oxidase subunit 1 [Candidatus Johnevansia muelleri]|uniref:Cytochrome bo(3) ubiquinol oxidase subunit 1 n=1 Tax=Candidatus Johnevansia muelleri TaxID=1495769 RepID=A0A078KAZ4_9GAMM|nr:Ubiquinol oxidase subunit 1 [Candidatus Evansia muelleri]